MIHEFSTSEVSEILELKVTRIHQWLARGYFRPTMSKAKGSGSRNRFSLDDVYRIALFAKLVSRGYSCEATAEYIGATVFGRYSNNESQKANFLLSKERPQYLVISRMTNPDKDAYVDEPEYLGWSEPLPPHIFKANYLKNFEAVGKWFAHHDVMSFFETMEDAFLINLKMIMDEVDRGIRLRMESDLEYEDHLNSFDDEVIT